VKLKQKQQQTKQQQTKQQQQQLTNIYFINNWYSHKNMLLLKRI